MKNLMLFLFLTMVAFSACKQDQYATVDINTLQKSMDNDPEVAKLRSLLFSHTRLLAAFPNPELKVILDQLHSCGLYSTTATLTELETCLADHPLKGDYIAFQKQYRAYDAQEKIVHARFPELAQLSYEKRAELLVSDIEPHAEEVLSDYLSNLKKQ
jgi:hypothetical protein